MYHTYFQSQTDLIKKVALFQTQIYQTTLAIFDYIIGGKSPESNGGEITGQSWMGFKLEKIIADRKNQELISDRNITRIIGAKKIMIPFNNRYFRSWNSCKT